MHLFKKKRHSHFNKKNSCRYDKQIFMFSSFQRWSFHFRVSNGNGDKLIFIVRNADGLLSNVDGLLLRHISSSYDFRRAYVFCNHARWPLNIHNIHYGFLATSDNVRCSCSSLKEPVKVSRKEIANQTEFRQL